MNALSPIRLTLIFLLAYGALLASLFLPAGRLDWWQGWGYFALLALTTGASSIVLLRRDPELIRRRFTVGEGTSVADRVIAQVIKMTFLGAYVLGALDGGRFGWSRMPEWLWPVGALLHLVGYGIVHFSMLANTHFESTVRIQRDRDHRVIDTGPYAVVRHPGYSGFLLLMAAVPLLLGSGWAAVPLAVGAAVLVFRIHREERLLRMELPGYANYMEKVRHRLVPGVW